MLKNPFKIAIPLAPFLLLSGLVMIGLNICFANQQEDDTVRLNALVNLTKQNVHSNPGLALEYCDSLMKLSDSLNISTGLVDAFTERSRIYFVLGDPDSAKILCREAIRLSGSLKDTHRLAVATYHESVLVYITEGPQPANELFQKSYRFYLAVSDSSGMANALNGIGVTFFEQAKYDSAIYYYLKSIRIAELKNLEEILGKTYLNMGLVYDEMNEHGMAIRCFSRSIVFNRELNNRVNVAKALHNTGNIYVQEKEFDSALLMYNKGLELNLELDYLEGIANSYIGLGDVSDQTGNYDKAAVFFKKARYYYGIINHRQGLLISYKNLGLIEWRRGNYSRALEVYDSSMMIAREYGLTMRELEISKNITDVYVSKGDYLNAYKNALIWFNLHDSLINIEKREKIADLELQYEKEKDMAQILFLKNENLEKDLVVERRTRQRNTYLFSGAGIVVLLVFFFSYYSQRTRKNRIINEQRIRQLEEEKKLLAARFLVEGQEEERKRIAKELHDGLGVLLSSAKMHFTTIRDKSPESRGMIDKATRLLEQATGDVRRISHNMMPGLLTKFGLYEAVEDLIEQVDEMEGIHAAVVIEGEQERLKENTEIMLYRIIQEMVNNTLKHAKAKNVALQMFLSPGRMKIVYSDDGAGFVPEKKTTSQSLGLKSIASRVKFLGGEYKLDSKPGEGVRYEIEVPL